MIRIHKEEQTYERKEKDYCNHKWYDGKRTGKEKLLKIPIAKLPIIRAVENQLLFNGTWYLLLSMACTSRVRKQRNCFCETR